MPRTDDQRAADMALEAAIEQCQNAYAVLDPRSSMVGFIVVVEGQAFNDDGDMFESWGLIHPNGEARTTVATGLLSVGLDLLSSPGYERVDEPDE